MRRDWVLMLLATMIVLTGCAVMAEAKNKTPDAQKDVYTREEVDLMKAQTVILLYSDREAVYVGITRVKIYTNGISFTYRGREHTFTGAYHLIDWKD